MNVQNNSVAEPMRVKMIRSDSAITESNAKTISRNIYRTDWNQDRWRRDAGGVSPQNGLIRIAVARDRRIPRREFLRNLIPETLNFPVF